jgi:2-oxoisovalerate dehydrogenase E1 component
LKAEDLLGIHRAMVRSRLLEERLRALYRQGRLTGGCYTGIGNEAVAVCTAWALGPDDVLLPMHRDMGAHLVRGHSAREILAQYFKRRTSQTGGRDSGLHLGAPGSNIVGMISHLGHMMPVAAGVALAERLKGTQAIALTYIGDGGTSTGDFHEALNFAAVQKLGAIFVVENNQWAYGTPNEKEFACEDLATRATGYGMVGTSVDGTDAEAVLAASREAVARARAGKGPSLIVTETMRMTGHAEHDDAKYVPKEMFEKWRKKDPIERIEGVLRKKKAIDEEGIVRVRAEADKEIEEAVEWAEALEKAVPSDAIERVFATTVAATSPSPSASAPTSTSSEEVTFVEAIRRAQLDAMREDPKVFLLGEDIGLMGGAFRATQGLLEEFGEGRVVDTPISESLIVGAAIGAAIRGLRPVAEMQFADFVTCGFSQLVQNASTFHWRLGVAVPMVVRLPSGGGVGGGPFHSRSPEAWLAHSPGLKVVCAATVADAYGLLRAAIDDDDPVLFLEPKVLYRRLKAPLPDPSYRVPLGKAAIARTGRDATVVTWGGMVPVALEAAESVRDAGDVEVLDLRSIVPLDREAVLGSVRKTSRLLVLHDAHRTAGFGAEVAALVAEEAFGDLDAPVRRLASPDAPTPAETSMEAFTRPDAAKTAAALRSLLAY